MAQRRFPAPDARTHTLYMQEGVLRVAHSWAKELGLRALMLVGGGFAAGFFLMPWFVLPDELAPIKLVFAAVGVPLGLLVLGAALVVPPKRFDVELGPGGLEVRRGPGPLVGDHPLSAIGGIVHAHEHPGGRSEAAEQAGAIGYQRVGLYVRGVGTVGVLRSRDGDQLAQVLEILQERLAEAGHGATPTWPVAPTPDDAGGLEMDDDGQPGRWPAHARITVETGDEQVRLALPAPTPRRRALAYGLGALPLVTAVAGLAAVALLSPPTSWHPFAMLADPDALALGIVGAWFVAALPATKRLIGWVHGAFGKGPYRLVVTAEGLTVLGDGSEVLDEVAADQVLGFEVTRFGLKVLGHDDDRRLPVYGLTQREDRAWLAQALACALERWGGKELAQVEVVRRPRGAAGARVAGA